MYIAKVPEKSPENTFVTVVRAIDPDLNPSITYAITSSQTALTIESSTGVVRTRRSLDPTRGESTFENPHDKLLSLPGTFSALKSFDYEVKDNYKVQVEAVSGSSKKTVSTDIDIKVLDVKDSPSFSKPLYEVHIDESTAKSTTINTGIRIIDEDTLSDKFECSMENITSLKTIDYLSVVQDKGECKIVTVKSLDTSVTPQFNVEMRATDKNFRNMFASTEVVVKVVDKNNHAPEFSQSLASYWVSVSSSTTKDKSILKLSTFDKDQGSLGEVTYQLIQSGSSAASSRFSIDDNSGVITSSSKLIKDTIYQLQAKAIDGGQKSATVSVYVSVYDTVDTPVKFEEESYSGSKKENAAKNTEVVPVKAKRSGSSSGISYELVGGYKEDSIVIFTIGSSTGKVLLNSGLDRERKSSYKVIIRAKHVSGKVELATNVECTISVDDINDVAPKFAFDKDPKTFSVDNYSPADTKFGTVNAIDLDQGANGKVTYSIDSSSASHPFKIDADKGTLMTKEKLTTFHIVSMRFTTDGGRFRAAYEGAYGS
ncbi:hypothetical protein QZH41_017135 [Actinostola sp. cb2023]|nr:hypothetical protein QZH41_017135 [Actinostola sp. cb2023]